jgi:hypothetical protein
MTRGLSGYRCDGEVSADEPPMIAVGAILGGIVGEIQVLVMEHFGH